MFIFPNRVLRAIFITLLLSLASFSVSGEELIIKFSTSINDQQSASFLTDYGLEMVEKIESMNICTVTVPSGIDIDQLINTLNADDRTKYVEKNMDSGKGAFVPNDTFYQDQWHHATINSERAWDISRGSRDIIIAVLDSGLQLGNTDLSGSRFLSGFDFVNNDNNTDDDQSHGTYVTGLIAANADNGFSGAGVDHFATILPVKVLNADNNGTTFDLVQGIDYAVNQGADVINMSLGGYPNASSLNDALSMARANNVILISSAGNGGIGNADESYPGASPLTISVGATTISNERAFFSATGAALDVVAPGSAVPTTGYPFDDGLLDFFNGTSAAAPIVTGVAALAKALNPDLTHDQFNTILSLSSQDQVGSPDRDTLGRDDFFGWGLLDAAAALELVNPGLPQVPTRIEAQAFSANFDSSPGDFGDNVCDTGDTDSQATSDLGGVCNIGWTAAGEWLEYDIFVSEPGFYDLNLRLASRPGGDVSIELDGLEIEQLSVDADDWQNFADHIVSTHLTKGAHTIRVNFIDGNVNFNFLDIKQLAVSVPARIEAENFLASFETTAGDSGDNLCDTGDVDSQVTEDETGVCNIGWTATGEWLEYGIAVDQPGSYFFNLRLASSPGGEVSIEVDGVEIDRVSVSPNGWQNYSDYIVNAQLSSGTHTVRINFIDGNVNFNYLDVTSNTEATITPIKDAYIRGGDFADDNYGPLSNLVIKGNNNDNFTRKAYLQFNIAEFSNVNVERAVVRLYANRADESLEVALHRINANNASEFNITWNNTPIEGSEVAFTSVFSSAVDRYYEWDVTDYLREKISYNTFNVLIRERNNVDYFIHFNSQEASSNPPELVITFGN